MEKDLIVDASSEELISIAVLEDDLLVELHHESRGATHVVGDIYLGRVERVIQGMNAAFVDVGFAVGGFLHYGDLHENFLAQQDALSQLCSGNLKPSEFVAAYKKNISSFTSLPKEGKISDYIKNNDKILVQVTKEAISTKGPRLTTALTINGRNQVISPFDGKVSASAKLNHKESARLKNIVNSINTTGCGVIVRTAAEGKQSKEMQKDLEELWEHWLLVLDKLLTSSSKRKKSSAICLYEESGRALGVLRDTYDKSFRSIWVNEESLFHDIEKYLGEIAPEDAIKVQLYTGKLPIFDDKGVTKQIKALMKKYVKVEGGAYLVIESTEAMHVIDVNSGTSARRSEEQETTAFEVNKSAAEEIARQLRLRDLGGIIIVDFIDMKSKDSRDALYKQMVDLMSTDRSRHEILPLSKFGLMQITRQRIRPATKVDKDETCPSCQGKGKITEASILLVEKIEDELSRLIHTLDTPYINVHVHPYVDAYLKKGLYSISMKWRLKISSKVHITPNQDLSLIEYRYYDKSGEELIVHKK